jgi:DNA-binding NarL/FixJ family response regulator
VADSGTPGEDAESGSIRVLVVDDHRTFAELLIGAFSREDDLASVGWAGSVEEGTAKALQLRPDVVVLDYHLPDGTGLAAAARIFAAAPATRIVMLTGAAPRAAMEQAAGLGICAFLPKDGSLSTVLDAIRHSRNGAFFVHPSLMVQSNPVSRPVTGPVPSLTPREREVLRLMSTGTDVRTSANLLGMSTNTCRGHVKSILAKLGAHSQLEAVATATRLGLLSGQGHG